MNERTKTLLALVCLLFLFRASPGHALGGERSLSQFGQQTWGSDSGLPQNTVHAILQTHDGFLWAGTEAGLVRYDGVQFRIYDTENTPELRSGIINDLKEDRAGTLWISTAAGLVREKRGIFTFFGLAQGLPSASVSSTYITRGGELFALTSAGIARFERDRFLRLEASQDLQGTAGPPSVAEDDAGRLWIAGARDLLLLSQNATHATHVALQQGEPRTLAILPSGDLWVGSRSGIEVIHEGHSSPLPASAASIPLDVTTLLADGMGGMWIGTTHGLARWRNGLISPAAASTPLADAPIERLFRDREGSLWATTPRDVARLTDHGVELLPRRSRISGVLSIYEDREGSLWFGSDNAGLSVMREQAFSTVSEEQGLTAGPVRAIFQDREGIIWIGTNGGGLSRIDGGRVSTPVSHPALSSDTILALAQTGTDLWVGTPNGLNRLRGTAVKIFTTEDGLADDFVRSLYSDPDGSLWIGTRNGLSHRVGTTFESFSRMDGLGSDLIGTILRTRGGELWIGTLGGLSRRTPQGFQNLTSRDGLGSDAVTSLLEDATGTLWIGSRNAGLTRLRDGALRAIPLDAGDLPDTVFGMLEDASGALWLSSRKGVSRVAIADLNAYLDKRLTHLPVRLYGTADGMRLSEASSGGHPAAWRMHDGSLWFATLDGAAFVSPESIARNTLPPPIVIEEVLVNDRTVDMSRIVTSGSLALPPGDRRIEIRYAGLSFVAPGKVHYRYKLEGFDKDWIDAGTRREAFYTNLPPGHLRFLVLSANGDGVWSTAPAAFDLRVQPTLMQTWWFYALLALLLGAIVFAIYRWRVHTVEAQYKAVLGERGRIAREIHDTLAQGYVAISVQLEVATRLLGTSREAALQQLDETRALVRSSLAEARSSIWNLRSQTDAGTLPSRLATVTERRSSTHGPALKLEIKGTYRPVAARVEAEIVRVAQEAVANAIRHAGAKQVCVTLRYDASTLLLEIRDDGRGFEGSAKDQSGSGHFGVQGMRERAARIGATLTIQSAPADGTLVILQIDPQHAEKEERP